MGQVYYYTAFAFDDRDNWSAPAAGAQWKSEDVQESSALDITEGTPEQVQKFLHNGHLYLRRASDTYTVLGQQIRK